VGRARYAIALAAVVGSLLAAPSASADLRWRSCEIGECARLSVPLDRSGRMPGSVSLRIQRREARRDRAGETTFLLAGGPGQSAIIAYELDLAEPGQSWLAPLARRGDLIAFDQRGTGGSGLLRCRDLEWANGLDPGHTAEACAVKLGPRRSHYMTSDSVEDLEAVRQALGGPRVTLVGVSYGTYLAQRYAIRYPANVERMVLDSVVDTTGVDALYRDSFSATRRVLEGICRRSCGFTRDAAADVGALVSRLAQAPLTGTVVRPSGRRRPAELTRQGLFYSFAAGDLAPALRAEFPAAVKSALRGDSAPILRLQQRSLGAEAGGSARLFSTAALAAAVCEEASFPYPRSTPSTVRAGLSLAAAQSQDAGLFAPFDAWTAGHNDLLRFCRTWPTSSPGPPVEPDALPDVPTLLLAGRSDTRTPVETARRVAARLPRGQLVTVTGSGHSVLGNGSCGRNELADFMAGRRVAPRCRDGDPLEGFFIDGIAAPAPASLQAVPSLPGSRGARGRVLNAVILTILDWAKGFAYSLDPEALQGSERIVLRVPGLRGGNVVIRGDEDADDISVRLRRLEYVPGVRLSGRLSEAEGDRGGGIIRINGPAGPDGWLRLGRRYLSGRLGGRPVRVRFTHDDRIAVAAAMSQRAWTAPPGLAAR
jgi:pimeloyl-ACP methyl ester carboxylesterase